jgi:hypothetical protein
MDTNKILPHNWAMIMADREVAGEEATESALLMEGVMSMMGLTIILGAAITLMARAIPVTMGAIPGTEPSRRDVLPGVTPVTW